jgi:hypothetical protein
MGCGCKYLQRHSGDQNCELYLFPLFFIFLFIQHICNPLSISQVNEERGKIWVKDLEDQAEI